MAWPMRSALDPRQRRPKNPKPKAGPDLCADCQHLRKYHNAVGCLIENCWCAEFTRTATANHCACQHDGRGELTSECQEHQEIREQRDELLAALKRIVETDFLKNESGVRQAIPVRWNRALEIAYAAIEKAEGK